MTKKKFMNKQQWRLEQGFLSHKIPVQIVQLLLYGIIAVGVTDFIELSWDLIVFMLAVSSCYFWIVGYVGDKTGYWLEYESRRIKMISTESIIHQLSLSAVLNGIVIADLLKTDKTALLKDLKNELDWFESRTSDVEEK